MYMMAMQWAMLQSFVQENVVLAARRRMHLQLKVINAARLHGRMVSLIMKLYLLKFRNAKVIRYVCKR